MKRIQLLMCSMMCVVAGCSDGVFIGNSPSQLDGQWLVEYSNSPNPTCVTFTDGKITSELAACSEPILVTNATVATIDGNDVSFSYTSEQTLILTDGTIVNGSGISMFEGTLQEDGSIAGSVRGVGTLNGVAFDNTLGFIMVRL